MVPVTFLGFWGGYPALVATRVGRAKSAEKISENAERGAGGPKFGYPPPPNKNPPADF